MADPDGTRSAQTSAAEGSLAGASIGSGGVLYGHSLTSPDAPPVRMDRRDYDRQNSSVGLTKADVVDWTERGMSDEIIIERIERSKAVFQVTAADQNELRDKGVSPAVIQAMRASARR
jgi:hypothetical protein